MISPKLEEYIEKHTSAEEELLYRLRRETHLKTVYPQMLTGPVLGRFLSMISRVISPARILEIGTFTAYSAICLAKGLTEEGILHTIDSNAELRQIQEKYILKAGLQDKIILHTGNALQVIPGLNEIFDLVFIDAAKELYLDFYQLVIDKVRAGGVILADNALWGGKVLEPEDSMDKETMGIIRFNRFIQQDDRVQNVLLSVRDGLMMIRKVTDPPEAGLPAL